MWNTAYELMYQWIGQRITPFKWSDAQVNKALNSFLASKTTVDVRIQFFDPRTFLSPLKKNLYRETKEWIPWKKFRYSFDAADWARRDGGQMANNYAVFSVLRIRQNFSVFKSRWNQRRSHFCQKYENLFHQLWRNDKLLREEKNGKVTEIIGNF